MSTKKPTPAQLAARKKFAAMAKSGELAKKRKAAGLGKPKPKKRKNPQTGKTTVYNDKKIKAKKPGKRVSASGNVYYERRANRSDVGKLLAPLVVLKKKVVKKK